MHMDRVAFTSNGGKIVANLNIPFDGAPCVIMSHGMEGSKDGTKWQVLTAKLNDVGIASLRFNYRGCGEGEDQSEGEFEDSTLSNRVQDFRSALAFVEGSAVDSNRLGVIGSSLGGVVAIAAWDERIKVMVTMATPYKFPMPTEELLNNIQRTKYWGLPSGRRIKSGFLEELQHYDAGLDISKITCPMLIIHGSADIVVPVDHSRQLYEQANKPKKLEIIHGGSHGFDDPIHLQQAVSLAVEWLKQYI
jgi:dipeptidyl aminopeptidase/acylaminoacyl peptidase